MKPHERGADATADPYGVLAAIDELEATRTGRRARGPYIRGPIPLDWVIRACRLTGKTAQVAFVLWYLRGLHKSNHFALRPSVVRAFGISRPALYRALTALEAAGLLRVVRHPGRAATVTIITSTRDMTGAIL
jgi:hypothetical protein